MTHTRPSRFLPARTESVQDRVSGATLRRSAPICPQVIAEFVTTWDEPLDMLDNPRYGASEPACRPWGAPVREWSCSATTVDSGRGNPQMPLNIKLHRTALRAAAEFGVR